MGEAASPRILLFTGKGGVGKTTAAAATALRCADAGLRTIILSTDPAHSLADAFDVPLTSVGSPITPKLWGQQLDAQERLEDAWGEIQEYVMAVLGWAGVDVFAAARRFYDRLDGVRELLNDSTRTSVRLVVNPERMVIAEARRLSTYLSLFGYGVDAVIANRLLPEAVTDPWFKAWKDTHAEHLSSIEEGFAPLPILKAELAPEELVGVDKLRRFADLLYGEAEAHSVFHRGDPLRIRARGKTRVLSLDLPFADKDDLEVARRDGELLVRVGPHRRAIVLPDSLRKRAVGRAKMVDDRLEISFVERTA